MKKVYVVTTKILFITHYSNICSDSTFILGVFDSKELAEKCIDSLISSYVKHDKYIKVDESNPYIIYRTDNNGYSYSSNTYEIKECTLNEIR